MKSPAWSDAENAALIALYFRMLDGTQRVGKKLNKARLIRIAQGAEPDHRVTDCEGFSSRILHRSRGSIESKLMNASACHCDLDPQAVTMDGFGYRALGNYQASLKSAMSLKIETRWRGRIGRAISYGGRYA